MYNWCVSPDNDTLLSPVLSICFLLHSFYFALIFRSSADAFTATVKCTPMAPNTGLLSNNNDSDLLEISGMCPTSRRRRHSPQYTCGASVYLSLYPEQADGVSHTCTTTHPHPPSRKDIKHIFALEETRGVSIFPTSSRCTTLSPTPLK